MKKEKGGEYKKGKKKANGMEWERGGGCNMVYAMLDVSVFFFFNFFCLFCLLFVIFNIYKNKIIPTSTYWVAY
jgi:hypothetical protein